MVNLAKMVFGLKGKVFPLFDQVSNSANQSKGQPLGIRGILYIFSYFYLQFFSVFRFHTRSIKAGRIRLADPFKVWSAIGVRGVYSILISMSKAFFCLAKRGRDAAGCTTLLVPIEKKMSHSSAA